MPPVISCARSSVGEIAVFDNLPGLSNVYGIPLMRFGDMLLTLTSDTGILVFDGKRMPDNQLSRGIIVQKTDGHKVRTTSLRMSKYRF